MVLYIFKSTHITYIFLIKKMYNRTSPITLIMKEIPYLRCPVCGKISLLRNFLGFHRIDAFIQKIKGLGRGKGFSNKFEHTAIEGNLTEWWIKRLEEVIEWLKTRRKASLTIRPSKVSLNKTDQISSNASEPSVSEEMILVIPSYQSRLTKTKTLNVPPLRQNTSLKAEKSTLTLHLQ